MNYYQGSNNNLRSNVLKIDIHMVNMDVPNSLQNVLRSKFAELSQKLEPNQNKRSIKKNLTYINNRDLRPIDIVLRMNPNPEVALMGWQPPFLQNENKRHSPSVLKHMVNEDAKFISYRKVYQGQRLRNTINVLVGNIDSIVMRSLKYGLDVKVQIKKSYKKLFSDEEFIAFIEENSKMTNKRVDVDVIDIDYQSDWDELRANYDLAEIEKLQIMNLSFNALIDVRDKGDEFIFDQQSFYSAFIKIWNIERQYFDLCLERDIAETRLIVPLYPVLVVLKRDVCSFMANQLKLEGMQKVYSYESIEEFIDNQEELKDIKFAGVICTQEDKSKLMQFPSTIDASFIFIDTMIDHDIWVKFQRLEFDITDEKEFNILTENLQRSLNEINIDLDPTLRKYVPQELESFLKANFSLICKVVRVIVSGQKLDFINQDLNNLNKIDEKLRSSFKFMHKRLENAKNTEFQILSPIVNKIKSSMQRVNDLKKEIDTVYNEFNKVDSGSSSVLPEIEKLKSKLTLIAEKQYILAQAVGNFMVGELRSNKEVFEKSSSSFFSSIKIPIKKRRVFNFDSQERKLFSNSKIYFITRNINIARILVTLMKAESIPKDSFIKIQLPSPKPLKATWVFYDRSVKASELNNVQTDGFSFYDSGNINEVLTKSELAKKAVRDRIVELEATYKHQAEKFESQDDKINRLSTEHDDLLIKIRNMSSKYASILQKFRLISQLYISYNIFYSEVFRKLNAIRTIIDRLEQIALQYQEKEINQSRLINKTSRQISQLTEILTSFYFSLAFLRFTTRVLNTLPKISEKLTESIVKSIISLNKLKNRIPTKIQNGLFISSNDFAAERLLENILSMAMLQFRITRDNFKLVDTVRYRRYLNSNIGLIVIAINGEGNQLEHLAKIISNIREKLPDAAIMAICQYPSTILVEYDMLQDTKLVEQITYIKKEAFLADSNQAQPDNRLQITSLYLYAMS